MIFGVGTRWASGLASQKQPTWVCDLFDSKTRTILCFRADAATTVMLRVCAHVRREAKFIAYFKGQYMQSAKASETLHGTSELRQAPEQVTPRQLWQALATACGVSQCQDQKGPEDQGETQNAHTVGCWQISVAAPGHGCERATC